jgi:transcription elongation factor GreA
MTKSRTNLMTTEGKKQLEEELKALQGAGAIELEESLVAAQQAFEKTGDDSDLSIARDRKNFATYRIQVLIQKCSEAEVIPDSKISTNTVEFGSKAILENQKRESMTLKIVGVDEANIRKDKISIESPLAGRLLGKKVGDQVELNGETGPVTYRIVEITL